MPGVQSMKQRYGTIFFLQHAASMQENACVRTDIVLVLLLCLMAAAARLHITDICYCSASLVFLQEFGPQNVNLQHSTVAGEHSEGVDLYAQLPRSECTLEDLLQQWPNKGARRF